MNTKIGFSVLTLVLAAMACNAPAPSPSQPSNIPAPSETMTASPTSPLPTATLDPAKPRIEGVRIGIGNAPQEGWEDAKTTGPYPHTHIPANINIVAVTFYLELPEGWPERNTELLIRWYRNGVPLEDWDGSIICTAKDPCSSVTSSHFSSDGYEKGRYEVRLYLGDELLEGSQAEVWLISEEWVGDLRIMQCNLEKADTCENAGGSRDIFPEQITIPAGNSFIYVGNGYANLPLDMQWQIELYRENQLIDLQTHVNTEGPSWSGWWFTRLTDPNVAVLEPGLYTVKLIWKGNLAETISFEVK